MAATAARKSASAPRRPRRSPPFPAHWAPNDLLIYTGKAFPAAYQGGAFIAFHGSWNRAPQPQGGYNVVFQPLKDGKASGDFVVFADGFAGAVKEPGRAAFRPTGLAMAPDGALFISDDVHGRIWRVTFHGTADAPVAAAPAPQVAAAAPASPGRPKAPIPMPAGPTRRHCRCRPARPGPSGARRSYIPWRGRGRHLRRLSWLGRERRSAGAVAGQRPWVFGDGSLKAIAQTIANGVPKPKNYSVPMPAKGGAPLSDSDVAAVAAYVWAISHRRG